MMRKPPLARWLLVALLLSIAAALARAQENNPPRLERNPQASMPAAAPVEAGEVALEFSGNTRFGEAELRETLAEQLKAISEQGLTAAQADDTAFFLGVFYRKQGYSRVEVKWAIRGRNRLHLAVAEGPQTQLAEISFEGVTGLPEATLRDYIIGTTRERFPRMKGNLPFVEVDVQTGVERIRGLYRSEGFLHAEVQEPEITLSPDRKSVAVLVRVAEGVQYRFGRIDVTGDVVFFPNTELLRQLEPFSRKPYTPQQVTNMQRSVVYYYKSRGYFKVDVQVSADPANAVEGSVPVTFTVNSGSIYRFDGVSVTGLDRLSRKFLPNRFAALRGAFYNPARLDEQFREMMRTGLFSKLRIEPIAHDDAHEIELHMEVEEAKAKELGFSGGYGTYEGPFIGLTTGDRNLFGLGRPLTANVEVSQRYLKGEILYVDPWLFESEYNMRLRAFGLTQEFEGYSKFELGARAQLARKLTKQIEASVFGLARDVEVESMGIELTELGRTSYLVNSLGASLTLDTRDSPINPGRGFVGNATMDVASSAFGSNIEFVRTTVRFSYFLPIKKTLLAFGARGGLINPFANQLNAIPIDERFFNGGSRSVRSFPERELGPKDANGFPIGGETFTTLNAEYIFPLFGDLLGAVFTDAGSVGREVADGVGEMRYAIGLGLRYRLPVGPLRIDYGVNPSRKKEEPFGAFHLSFGFAF
jgi:outer membrane protein insertion porin family